MLSYFNMPMDFIWKRRKRTFHPFHCCWRMSWSSQLTVWGETETTGSFDTSIQDCLKQDPEAEHSRNRSWANLTLRPRPVGSRTRTFILMIWHRNISFCLQLFHYIVTQRL